MPDVYNTPIPVSFDVIGAASAATTVKRKVIPFDYEIVGVSATANTAPTGAALIFDILAGPTNTAPGSLVSIWPVNNGTNSMPDHRPTIAVSHFDQSAIAATTTTVTPEGTDPPLSGQSTGVSTTYVNYDGYSFLAKPDPNPVQQFGSTGPDNTGNPAVVVNAVEGGTLNQPAAPANVGYQGHAGDVLQLKVAQVGATVAGSDIVVTAILIQR